MLKTYDLEDRTFVFAKRARVFVRGTPKDLCNIEDARQLVKASGSVGAIYIEANEALSKKDFVHRIRIFRKEAKECRYWLRLIETNENRDLSGEQKELIQESQELMNIFGAIFRKSE